MLSAKELWLLIGFAAAVCVGGVGLYVHHHSGNGVTQATFASAPHVSAPVTDSVPVEDVAQPTALEPMPALESLQPVAVLEAPDLSVSVMGAVAVPGVYRLEGRARVQDLVDAAGGPLDYADLSDINLAAELVDGSTLTIPSRTMASRVGDALVVRGGGAGRVPNLPQYTISGWRPAAASVSSYASREGSAPAAAPVRKAGDGLIDLNQASPEELESLPGIGPKLSSEIIRYRTGHPFASIDDLTNVPGIGPKKLEAVRSLVTVGAS